MKTYLTGDGYVCLRMPNHPRCNISGYIMKHRYIAENALGSPLCKKHIVHHFDRNKENNKNNNLVICEDTAYHFLLHKRKRVYDECGHAGWEKCPLCKKYSDPKYLSGKGKYHLECWDEYLMHERNITKFKQWKREEKNDKN